jgi:hypothetical protein
MDSLDPRYEEWCKKIAKSRELSDLISGSMLASIMTGTIARASWVWMYGSSES